ncbi:structure-specific endonuclease subunit SLX4 isoform X2 [Sphaerodactylus townsendi]|uniref:structure-specific endonuclease subunit SLX4 isoform X2 n=1 Tax=Sphaerodactylus townsendi TaxID=933632 RepID=UPI002025E217|nr:structure-specific endonuclease subunit SLX4 isoform X2 [Sphaerodactylus townsendi]
MDGDDDFKELRGRRRRRQQGQEEKEEESRAAGGGPGQAVAQEGPGEPGQAPTAAAFRGLGEVERLHLASAGNSPDCPFCGKGFGTLETRGSHLKRCAARVAVPPPLLLQVVRQQSSGLPASLSGLKRKVSSFTEQSTKKRKTGTRIGDAEEELLVAMAMSRSLREEEEAKARLLTRGRTNRAYQGRKNPQAEKKNRAVASHSPPRLLLQDPEVARRQMEERMALLLSEVEEFPSTPLLAPSQLLESELTWKADWPLTLPRGPLSSLWECSSLRGLSDPGSVCVAGSTLPALPGQTDQRPTQSMVLPFGGSVRAETEDSPWEERKEDAQEGSQKEAGALRDLMLLAGEGLTLTQWSPAAQPVEEPEWAPSDSQRSNPNRSLEKKLPVGSSTPSALLGSLAAAFKGMVNNPHLSDIQFQVDSGELFYAHMFVLYARCPQLMELVDQKGFLVAEEGGMRTPRVLLNDVSGEAVRTFFNYLYSAETFVPPQAQSDVAALATRFGMTELVALCESCDWNGHPAVDASGQEEEESGQEEEERVEKFEELLKSIWMGEEEEDRALLPEELGSENVVDEQGLEEIYEFAATQRKAEEGRCSLDSNQVEPEAVPGDSSKWEGHLDGELSHLQAQGARRKAVLGLLDPGDDQRPLGAASRRHLAAALLELAEASEELSEKSLQPGSWGESSQLFQQSCSGKDPSDDDDDDDVMKPFTPLGLEKQLLPVCRNFSSGDSQVSLVVPAGKSPASPKRRRGIGSDTSLSLFSPTPQKARGAPCRSEEQELPKLQSGGASSGVAAGSGPDHTQYSPAPLPPSFRSCAVDVQGDLVQILGAEGEGRHGQRKQQVEVMGPPSKEQEASGAAKLCLGEDIPCCQGTREVLLGSLPVGEAGAGSRKMLLPGTPLLSQRGPDHEQIAKPGLASSPEAQEPAIIPSPKRHPLRAGLPRGLRSPSPGGGKAVPDVVIVEDSEDEAEAAPLLTWGSSVLEADLPLSEDDTSLVASQIGDCQVGSSPRSLLMVGGMLPGGSGTAGNGPLPHFEYGEEERDCGDGSGSRRRRFQDQSDVSEVLPLSQRLAVLSSACSQDTCHSARGCPSAPVPSHKTPDLACREREAPHTTPQTPIPSYSIMETPELKKELRRFGVRALPKKKMVLKLKEIFQYTHQRPDSTSSQPLLGQGSKAAPQRPASAAASSDFPKQQPSFPGLPQVRLAGGGFRGSCGADHQGGQMAKQGICLPAGSGRLKSSVENPVRGGQALAPCPKGDGLSRVDGDMSVILQSSSTEFETSMQTEEEEEDISPSQSSRREADKLVALRQYIHSRPALCRQILLYEPFELTGLQSELKQNDIRIGLGRLLEFLDTHCITFTTAETRREKRQRNGRQGRGRY